MSEPELPALDDVDRELRKHRLGVDGPELHGGLCGFLAGGGKAERRNWLAQVLADRELAFSPAADDPLDRLYQTTREQLAAPDFGFVLLLPDADEPVDVRGDALLGWCRGFLGGFGLAQTAPGTLSEESDEALSDLGRIAASDLSYEDPERDEEAFAEVLEFVRVAVLLLHSDCVLGPQHRRHLN